MPDPTAQELAAQVSNDLFPVEDPGTGEPKAHSSESPGSGEESLIDGQGENQASPDPLAATAPTPPPVQLKALPKAWKKDMQAAWEKLDPSVHNYVYEREENVMKGLQQYQEGHTRWNETLAPFKPLMEQHPDVNPVQLLQNLMHNHIRLLTGQDKVEHAKRLLESYGIKLDAPSGETQPEPNQEVIALKRELAELKASFGNSQKQAYQAAVEEKAKMVQAFFSDSKNEYAEELADDIHKLIQTGVAEDLPSAYEKACWLNPVVREKINAKQRSTVPPAPKTPVNIDESGSGKARTKAKSWLDTVDAVVAAHSTTH